MSVKWDVVDSLAGLSEDLKVEGNFVARIHDEVKKIRDERDALRKQVEALTAPLSLKPGERLEPNNTHWYTQVWCDGNGNLGPCSCADGENPKGHWRSGRRVSMEAVLREVAEVQRELCAHAVRELLDEEECDCPPEWPRCGLHRAALRIRATPLVTEVDK